jgi:hypothetical protein
MSPRPGKGPRVPPELVDKDNDQRQDRRRHEQADEAEQLSDEDDADRNHRRVS